MKKSNVKANGKKINDALLKVAFGCTVEEVTEEYAEIDGKMKLTKRRKTQKDIPPDLKAVQMLLAVDGENSTLLNGGNGTNGTNNSNGAKPYGEMSDKELEEEKNRLLHSLQVKQNRIEALAKYRKNGGKEKTANSGNETGFEEKMAEKTAEETK